MLSVPVRRGRVENSSRAHVVLCRCGPMPSIPLVSQSTRCTCGGEERPNLTVSHLLRLCISRGEGPNEF